MRPKSVSAFSVAIINRRVLIAACLASSATPALAADYWWRGQHDGNWNTIINGTTNFATNSTGLTARTSLPSTADNIRFASTNATELNTSLSSNFTVNSITLEPSLSSDVIINAGTSSLGTPVLNIGSGGIINNSSKILTVSTGLVLTPTPLNIAANNAPIRINSQFNFASPPSLQTFVINKSGDSTLILSGNSNNSSTILNISAGTVQIGEGGQTSQFTGRIVNNGHLIFNRSGAISYNSIISGPGNITKIGSGTLTLGNENTSTGTFTVSSGGLTIGDGSFSGSFIGNIVNNSLVTFSRRNDSIYSGNLSGSGSITKFRQGTIFLSGTNTYTGTTEVQGGTILVNSPASLPGYETPGKVIVRANFPDFSVLAVRAGGTNQWTQQDIDVLLANASFRSGGRLGIDTTDGDFQFSSNLATFTGFNKLGNNTLVFTGSIDTPSANLVSVLGGTLQIGSGGTTGSVTGNILNNFALAFNRSDDITYPSVISGSGSLTQLGTGQLTLSGNNTFTGTTTISAGSLQIGSGGTTGSLVGNVTNNATLLFNRSNNLTIPGAISGTGSIANIGPGLTFLTGSNTYQGTTTVQSGGLVANSPSSLPGFDTPAKITVASGALLGANVGGSNQWTDSALQSLIANTTFNTGSSFALDTTGGNFAFSGQLPAGLPITKLGNNTLILDQDISFPGTAVVSAGTLQIGSGGTTGSYPANITNNAALAFNRSDDLTHPGNISGTGSLTKLGTGKLTLTGSLTYTGSTTITQGSLEITDPSNATAGSESNLIQLGALSGSGTLIKSGSHTLLFTGPFTYTGQATVSDGIFQLGSGSAIGTFAGSIQNNATVVFNHSDSATISGSLSGSGSYTKLGTGTLTLSGNSTFTGSTTISQGTLLSSGPASLPSYITPGKIFVEAGTTLAVQAGGSGQWSAATLQTLLPNTTFSTGTTFSIDTSGGSTNIQSNISGNFNLLKVGFGTLTLSGNNTYTGNTTITSNSLQIGNGGTTGSISGNVSLATSASLLFNRSDSHTYSGNISGSGNFNKLGAGTLTLAGHNIYTGSTTVSAGKLILATPFTTGSTVALSGSASLELAPGGSNLLRTGGLNLGTAGTLITHDNDLIINYSSLSPLATLLSLQKSNRILSSPDLAGIPTRFVLFEAAALGLTQFSGFPVDATTVIGKYTYTGDANLDGQVDAFDYAAIDSNFGRLGSHISGDLNQDGFVDAFDYCMIDDTLGAGVGLPLRGVNNPLRPSGLGLPPSASTEVFIPEPASLSLLALSTGLLLARRRPA